VYRVVDKGEVLGILEGDCNAATGAYLGGHTLHAAAISCIASIHWRMALQAGWGLEFAIEGVPRRSIQHELKKQPLRTSRHLVIAAIAWRVASE